MLNSVSARNNRIFSSLAFPRILQLHAYYRKHVAERSQQSSPPPEKKIGFHLEQSKGYGATHKMQ